MPTDPIGTGFPAPPQATPRSDTEPPRPHPLTLDAELDRPSRALWLIKWLLLVPHYVVLFFLGLGAIVAWMIAFFAILITGRYPRPLFNYTVGVMRWGWRVSTYGYGLASTDRYPPFTLADVPDYPAHLDVAYPEQLSRGLVLVKWWLLAIPHYIVTGIFYGAAFSTTDGNQVRYEAPGLVVILVLIALIALLFRGTYPRSLFDLTAGLQRWGLRVVAYTLLLTDQYPPFRLDQGSTEPTPYQPPAETPSEATTDPR